MRLRDKLRLLVLTKQEQRTVAFIVLMVVLGLATKHYRAQHPPTVSPNERAHLAATPSASFSELPPKGQAP